MFRPIFQDFFASKKTIYRTYAGISLIFGAAGADKHYKFCLTNRLREVNDKRSTRNGLASFFLGGAAALSGVAAVAMGAASIGSVVLL